MLCTFLMRRNQNFFIGRAGVTFVVGMISTNKCCEFGSLVSTLLRKRHFIPKFCFQILPCTSTLTSCILSIYKPTFSFISEFVRVKYFWSSKLVSFIAKCRNLSSLQYPGIQFCWTFLPFSVP